MCKKNEESKYHLLLSKIVGALWNTMPRSVVNLFACWRAPEVGFNLMQFGR